MSAPQCWKIGQSGLEPPAGARNREKANVKIRRNPPLQILPLILNFKKQTRFKYCTLILHCVLRVQQMLSSLFRIKSKCTILNMIHFEKCSF